MIAIEMMNEAGGVLGKYKIVPIVADLQSSPDIALREAERLIEVEHVPLISGVISSSVAVPLAPVCERHKIIFFLNVAISDAVVKGRHLRYTFRIQPMGSQWGKGTVEFINYNYKKLGAARPGDVRVAVIYEDGPYGVSCCAGNMERIKEYGLNLVLKESYAHDIKDMTALITKLKVADAHVIFHTGYFPDITIFLRQARALGLNWKAYLGHGAGHADLIAIAKAVGPKLVEYSYNIDPPPAQILDPKSLTPKWAKWNAEFLRRVKEKFGIDNPPTHFTQGFVYNWILLHDVLPIAITKYGLDPGTDPKVQAEAIRKAFLDVDIPEGGTGEVFGVKFAPPEHEYAGQNLRAYPVVMQWFVGKWHLMWPEAGRTEEPKLPVPSDSPFAK
jgi:branched-chain amino acid transport system substrate-binding protein